MVKKTKNQIRDEIMGIQREEISADNLLRTVFDSFNDKKSREKFPNWVKNHVAYMRRQVLALKPLADGKLSKILLKLISEELDEIEADVESIIAQTPSEEAKPFTFYFLRIATMHYDPMIHRVVDMRSLLNNLCLQCLNPSSKAKASKRNQQPTDNKSDSHASMYG